jgi:hypothetical protein
MTPAAHLDDETISAVLDGELPADDDSAARAHLAGCAECRARLARFTDVAAAVAAPVDLPAAGAREAAIAGAIDGDRADGAAAGRRRWAPVLAVAAVLVALLLAAPLIGSIGSDDDGDFASGGARDDSTALESRAGALADGYAVDLGPVDRDTVDDAIAAQLGVGERPTAMAAPAPEASADDSAGAGASAAGGGRASDAQGGAAAGADTDVDAARACASRLDLGGDPTLVARATWDGTAAAVLAYRVGDDIRAYVVDPADCSILQFVRFRVRS